MKKTWNFETILRNYPRLTVMQHTTCHHFWQSAFVSFCRAVFNRKFGIFRFLQSYHVHLYANVVSVAVHATCSTEYSASR